MSSNYNRMPRPAAVLVRAPVNEAKGEVALILRRETPLELLRNDVVPAWLQRAE